MVFRVELAAGGLSANGPVFFMTELKLLRIELIFPRSTLSMATAGAATGGVTCEMGCSFTTGGSVFAGIGADTSGWEGH